MGKLFSPDGKVFAFLDAATDLVILSLLWLLCALPVVTIGTSTTSLYYVLFKKMQGTSDQPVREFFRCFRQSFRSTVLLTLVFLAAAAVMALDGWILSAFFDVFGKVPVYLLFVALILVLIVALYTFPLAAFFDDRNPVLIRNAFLISLRYFPSTVVILLTTSAPLVLAVALQSVTHAAIYAWIVIGSGLIARVNAHFLLRIFRNHLPDPK